MWCQAHPGIVAVEPPISPFLCASCATACQFCNEVGQPDDCRRDFDGMHCSLALRQSSEANAEVDELLAFEYRYSS